MARAKRRTNPITISQAHRGQYNLAVSKALVVLDDAAQTDDAIFNAQAERAGDLLAALIKANLTDDDMAMEMSSWSYWPRSLQRAFPYVYAAWLYDRSQQPTQPTQPTHPGVNLRVVN